MTERKTRSLTLPQNPVARMRELHDLDCPVPFASRATEEPSDVAADAPLRADVQQPDNPATPPPTNAATLLPTNPETQESPRPATPERASAAAPKRSHPPARQPMRAPPSDGNPVHQAMRQALTAPFSSELRRGPTTATTIRLPSDLWERLDMASTLLEQTRHDFHHKQDIIAEALKEFLARIGRGEV